MGAHREGRRPPGRDRRGSPLAGRAWPAPPPPRRLSRALWAGGAKGKAAATKQKGAMTVDARRSKQGGTAASMGTWAGLFESLHRQGCGDRSYRQTSLSRWSPPQCTCRRSGMHLNRTTQRHARMAWQLFCKKVHLSTCQRRTWSPVLLLQALLPPFPRCQLPRGRPSPATALPSSQPSSPCRTAEQWSKVGGPLPSSPRPRGACCLAIPPLSLTRRCRRRSAVPPLLAPPRRPPPPAARRLPLAASSAPQFAPSMEPPQPPCGRRWQCQRTPPPSSSWPA